MTIMEISDHDLVLRLRSFEDAFVERKTSADSKDWLKTIVAFANTAPVGYPAVLFIGVKGAEARLTPPAGRVRNRPSTPMLDGKPVLPGDGWRPRT
jgi:predicted HTH transcriptional regulator